MDRFAPIVSDSIFTTSILFDASVNAGVIPLRFAMELGSTFDAVSKDVTVLNVYLKLFNQLFTTEESVQKLNDAANVATGLVQRSLLDGMVLRVARLTDRASSNTPRGNVENLTFANLLENLPGETDELRQELEPQLDTINDKVAPFREWRHQMLAHSDKAAFMNDGDLLDGFSKTDLDSLVKLFSQFLNTINRHYNDSATLYEYVNFVGGGEELLNVLGFGLKYLDLQEEAIQGSITPERLLQEIRGF